MTSKFSSIIAAKKGETVEEASQIEEAVAAPTSTPEPKPKATRRQTHSPTPAAPAQTDTPRIGRPPTGKRSDPNFEQVTSYIRRDTYQASRIALIQEGDKRDFSDLIEELLIKWLKPHTK